MMILSTKRRIFNLWAMALVALVSLLAITACGEDPTPTPTSAPAPPTATAQPTATPEPTAAPAIQVVATTSIVADWVENIGGEHVEVFNLVPPGVDPHSYQPGAQDVARIADADLVLSVGLGLEESWLRELIQNAARDPSTIVELAELIDPIEFAESHIEDVELIEDLMHIVHEVEEGEISPEEGLEEIKELLANFEAEEGEHHGDEDAMEEEDDHGDEEGEEEEGEDHGDEDAMEEEEDHGEEDEIPAMAMEIVERATDGRMSAEEAIEAIEALTEEGEEEHEGHGHGLEDPHFWFDPIRVKTAVNDIASRLSVINPSQGDAFRANASAYNEKLDELHSWTEEQVSVVPDDRRVLITSHDSLGYFANLYDFEVIGVVLSITTEVEPSPEDLVHLIEEAIEYGVPAVFGETTVSERLARTVATESGAEFVSLYSGALDSGDSPASTYIGMVRTNVERIVEALR